MLELRSAAIIPTRIQVQHPQTLRIAIDLYFNLIWLGDNWRLTKTWLQVETLENQRYYIYYTYLSSNPRLCLSLNGNLLTKFSMQD